jgi:hypothetical protein
MKVSEVIQVCAYAIFCMVTLFLTFFKKVPSSVTSSSTNSKWRSWSDAIILLLLSDCLLIIIKILNILTFWNHDYVEISVFMMGLICKMLVTVMNRVHWKIEKFTIVAILSVDFVLMLYNMGFKYSSQAQLTFFLNSPAGLKW